MYAPYNRVEYCIVWKIRKCEHHMFLKVAIGQKMFLRVAIGELAVMFTLTYFGQTIRLDF